MTAATAYAPDLAIDGRGAPAPATGAAMRPGWMLVSAAVHGAGVVAMLVGFGLAGGDPPATPPAIEVTLEGFAPVALATLDAALSDAGAATPEVSPEEPSAVAPEPAITAATPETPEPAEAPAATTVTPPDLLRAADAPVEVVVARTSPAALVTDAPGLVAPPPPAPPRAATPQARAPEPAAAPAARTPRQPAPRVAAAREQPESQSAAQSVAPRSGPVTTSGAPTPAASGTTRASAPVASVAATRPASIAAVASPRLADAYGRSVGDRLAQAKRYPRAARRRGQEGEVRLAIEVDAGGRVISTRIARSSGHRLLDAEAEATVRRAGPFPPPPAGLAAPRLEVLCRIAFHLTEG